jgi:hypothetical protein
MTYIMLVIDIMVDYVFYDFPQKNYYHMSENTFHGLNTKALEIVWFDQNF